MADQWQGGSWRRVDNLKHECESKLGIREFIHSAGPAHVDLIPLSFLRVDSAIRQIVGSYTSSSGYLEAASLIEGQITISNRDPRGKAVQQSLSAKAWPPQTINCEGFKEDGHEPSELVLTDAAGCSGVNAEL